ncbi:MAG: SLC13 family permease [Opitutales bacterium]
MDWEVIFVAGLLVFAVVNFVWERLEVDVVATLVFAILLGVAAFGHQLEAANLKLPTVEGLIAVFANPAPLTIAAMFIISTALERSGAIELLTDLLKRTTKLGYPLFIFVLVAGVGGISAFMNNTPVVVIFLPVVLALARQMDTPASKLLIPLSYASIFGGVCTLIGTSTNILMSGIIVKSGYAPLGMFELAAVGLPMLVIASTYLGLFGQKVLPLRETLTAILSEEERKEFITEAYVKADSALIGLPYRESPLRKAPGVRLLEIIRDGVALEGAIMASELQEGDRLVLACRPSGIASARQVEGVDFIGEQGLDLEQIAAHEGAIVEGVIGPRSSIVGQTLRDTNFRQRFRMILLAVHRNGVNVREKLDTLRLDFGDTLLMMGTDPAIENLRTSDDIILLDRPHVSSSDLANRRPLVIGTLLAMIALVSTGVLPVVAASILAVAVLFVTGCVTPKDAYRSVDWRILILIYGMLALGQALEVSGTAALFAGGLTSLTDNPYLALAILYAVTSLFTEMLSNNATVVIMAPIALSLAAELGCDPRPFIIACCIASSASFSTPVGYQTNTYVYSVGGYRFTDFLRAGLPLNILYCIGSLILIPLVWSF